MVAVAVVVVAIVVSIEKLVGRKKKHTYGPKRRHDVSWATFSCPSSILLPVVIVGPMWLIDGRRLVVAVVVMLPLLLLVAV